MTTVEIIIIFLTGMVFGAWGFKLLRQHDKGYKAGWDDAFLAISKITWHVNFVDDEEDEE